MDFSCLHVNFSMIRGLSFGFLNKLLQKKVFLSRHLKQDARYQQGVSLTVMSGRAWYAFKKMLISLYDEQRHPETTLPLFKRQGWGSSFGCRD